MLLAKSRPIVVISISGGSLLVGALIATTLWHLDAGSGSHPPHLLSANFGSSPAQASPAPNGRAGWIVDVSWRWLKRSGQRLDRQEHRPAVGREQDEAVLEVEGHGLVIDGVHHESANARRL
jgi:hypothetical protein